MPTSLIPVLLVSLVICLMSNPALAGRPDRQAVIERSATAGEGVWRAAQNPPPNMGVRDLYTYALTLCEAGKNPERLKLLLERGAEMQDRDPNSRGFGNFHWYRRDANVNDYNAVEFCMQGGAPLWIGHRDSMPADARKVLADTLQFAVQGCLRHLVNENYTNIALMNAENLIILGEALGRKDAADEGYARLEKIYQYTLQNGIHEYCSPTYYGVDLDCLGIMEAFVQRPRGRQQVQALLELFWTDIACNWFNPAQRLAGAHSRSYDYLRGRGNVEMHLWYQGWIEGPLRGAIFPAVARWEPPAALRELSLTKLPRLVRQAWGPGKNDSRTHYLLPDVTLSCSAAHYHNMDFPLTVDFADANLSRCYFVPDGRGDPYGRKRIAERSGHMKSLHLRPFFCAAQQTTDALGLAIYRDKDALPPEANSLESHFVLPVGVDGLWIGDRRVEIERGKPLESVVLPGQAVVVRSGTAAAGVRVVWARDANGQPAGVKLVYDPKECDAAMRLTVKHHVVEGPQKAPQDAGAAFWVRVGSGLKDDQAVAAWRRQFAASEAQVTAEGRALDIRVQGVGGVLSLKTAPPYGECSVEPPSSRAVLELNGEDIGRRILQKVPATAPATGPAGTKGVR